ASHPCIHPGLASHELLLECQVCSSHRVEVRRGQAIHCIDRPTMYGLWPLRATRRDRYTRLPTDEPGSCQLCLDVGFVSFDSFFIL
ncbi:unnamed protein product, partial [Mycena citricolor]